MSSPALRPLAARPQTRGFTLVELLVSAAIIGLIMVILVSLTAQTGATWRYTTGKIEQFREARAGFELMTTRLSQATLNTYWDYDDPLKPTRYIRRSELRFLSGAADSTIGNTGTASRVTHCVFFHAPLGVVEQKASSSTPGPNYGGLENLLNVWGYYVELADDSKLRPPHVSVASGFPLRHRFRLMEFGQPAEKLTTYNHTSGKASMTYMGTDWFKPAANSSTANASRPIAENIVALLITPRLAKREEEQVKGSAASEVSPLAPAYTYDSSKIGAAGSAAPQWAGTLNSKNQLPPVLQLTMVAIDEISAARLGLSSGSKDIFKLANKFKDTARYTADLTGDPAGKPDDSLENKLVSLKCSHRVFTTNVPIRAAKWSREQTN